MKTNLLILAVATAFGLSAAVPTVQAAPGQGAQPRSAKNSAKNSAKYGGGQGSTWKMGRNQHGFSGSYGKCRFTGFAGPNGYKLDRSC